MTRPLPKTDHEHSELVVQAAIWWVEQPAGSFKAPVRELQCRFPLSPQESCEVLALADRMRILRAAFS
jgi:hypothetical protein